MIDRALKAAGIDLDNDRETWIAQRDPWNLDTWLAEHPTPRTPEQDAELADHMTRRQQLVADYWAQLPADTRQRIHDAIEADRRRWIAEQVTVDAQRARGEIAAPGGNPAYVTRALETEFDRLANTVVGCRNDTLLRVACSVFEFVKGGHVEHDPAWAELRRIAANIGLLDVEIERTLRSAWRRVGPRAVPAPGRRRSDSTTFHAPGVL